MLRGVLLPALVWTTALAGGAWRIQAQSEQYSEINREYAIKAAYLYQFGRYVEWPVGAFADSQSPLVIGVLGADPFGDILQDIARAKRVEGRPIVVRRFATMAEYSPCHILFVSASFGGEKTMAAIRNKQPSAVLLVGEEPGFAEHGGTINFFNEENKIRFEINAEAAKRERLKISSKLLSLAKIVGRY